MLTGDLSALDQSRKDALQEGLEAFYRDLFCGDLPANECDVYVTLASASIAAGVEVVVTGETAVSSVIVNASVLPNATAYGSNLEVVEVCNRAAI